MGIVFRQSLNNSIVTYAGFGIGALNTLVLYLNFMNPKYYGLIQVILSAATVLNPILAFGVPNTLVKFYSSFENNKVKEGFLTLMLLLPLVLMLPIAVLTFVGNEAIGSFLSRENPIVRDYVWHIFLIGMAMAYFEVFYGWARVHMKSVFGNFMKEVFSRVAVSVMLLLLHFEYITVEFFVHALVGVYVLRMIVMKVYAYSLHMPKLSFEFPHNIRNIMVYTSLIILGGSVAIVLLEVDKVMINQFIELENVAYYSVAGFIAMVIAVPSRSTHQITYPLTAEQLNNKDLASLERLYKKSSLTLFAIASLLFLLIFLNLDDMYTMMPEDYRNGYMIFVWLGLAKVYDSILGNNNSILYNSDYYKAILMFGVLLAVLTILLNLWLIPAYGLDGAAIASFSALFIYNTLKLAYVRWKFKILPFTTETWQVGIISMVLGVGFYYIDFPFHAVINIILKGILITTLFVGLLYKFKISEDLYTLLTRILSKVKR